jgi:hypothetical protein
MDWAIQTSPAQPIGQARDGCLKSIFRYSQINRLCLIDMPKIGHKKLDGVHRALPGQPVLYALQADNPWSGIAARMACLQTLR